MEERRIDFNSAAELAEYVRGEQGKAFILGSGSWDIAQVPPGFRPIIERVWIDPNNEDLVYTISGKEALTYNAIMKIAHGAGLGWPSGKSERTDDGTDPDVIEFRSVCTFTSLDGVEREYSGSYAMNFRDRLAVAVKKNGQAKAEAEIMQLRVFGLQRAESGAKKRAVCAAIGLKPGGLSGKELVKKPFIIPRAVIDIDMNDPLVRAMFTAKALNIDLGGFFGGGTRMLGAAPTGAPALQAAPAAGAPALPATPAAEAPAAPKVDEPADDGPQLPTGAQFAALSRDDREGWVIYLLQTRSVKGANGRIDMVPRVPDADLQRSYDLLVSKPLVGGLR